MHLVIEQVANAALNIHDQKSRLINSKTFLMLLQ
jgi:hypothetical protein